MMKVEAGWSGFDDGYETKRVQVGHVPHEHADEEKGRNVVGLERVNEEWED